MEKVFLQACRGEQTSHTPIWLNRQAGRYMPEYHQVKGDLPSLDFFKNPERAAKDAQDWAKEEPFLLHGIYSDIDIKPFKKSLP